MICHIAYVAAFHKWRKSKKNKIDVPIRRAYKTAMGLPQTTNTNRLLQLGVHNTLDEIAGAQNTTQLERLSTTKAGRTILNNLGIGFHEQKGPKSSISEDVRPNLRVDHIPRNVHPEFNKGRRRASAKALTDIHAATPRPDTWTRQAEYAGRNGFAVAVVDTDGNTRTAASTLCTQSEEGEGIAIALTIADRDCQTVLSDSRQAVRNFSKGRIAPAAVRILQEAKGNKKVRIKWFPAHASEASERNANRNETAHARARALTDRAHGGRPLWFSTRDGMTNCNEITTVSRLNRRLLPRPCTGLSRSQAVVFRKLQTGTLPSPALLHRMYPESHPNDNWCKTCRRETATFARML